MKKTIIIIGGGYTSLDLYQKLKDVFNITIIEPRSNFYHYIGMLRGVVNPEFNQALKHSYRVLGDVVVQDFAKSIDTITNSVLTQSGKEYFFDYLVIASGVQHTIRTIPQLSESIKNAQSIVLQGGGPIGIELAGEIITIYPTKKIYISHMDKLLLSNLYQQSFRKKLTDLVVKHRIEIISPDQVEEKNAELIVPCYGFTPNNTFLPDEWLSNKGFVKINHELRVVGTKNVFAVGDIVDLEESKQLINGWEHTKIIAYNLIHKKKKSYIGVKNDMIAIPFGPREGYTFVPYLGGITLGGLFTSVIKGQNLLRHRVQKLFRKT
jgi:apoptosis-inducing factor 2